MDHLDVFLNVLLFLCGRPVRKHLIDGERIWDLVEGKSMGLRQTTILDTAWFDRFD